MAAHLTDLANWSLWIAGLAIVIISMAALLSYRTWEGWGTTIIGVWLAISPWILGFNDAATVMWSTVIAGVLLLIAGLWTALTEGEGRLTA